MTHIAHVITGLDAGGAQTMLCRLIAVADGTRTRHTVIALKDGGVNRGRLDALGTEVVTLGMRPGSPNPAALFRLYREIRRLQPDVVQSWLYHADLACGLLQPVLRCPLIWNLRCSYLQPEYYTLANRVMLRTLAALSRWPDVVIANSMAGRTLHESLGYRPRAWKLIPNGFDIDVFRPDPDCRTALRDELGLPASTRLIGMIARFDPVKNHALFLHAARWLSERHDDVHFVLVGDGMRADNVELMRLVQREGLTSRLHLMGERADVAQITAGLDVSASSSLGEGFPNIVGEALCCGVPFVGTEVGDTATIVGNCGTTVPLDAPDQLADAFERYAYLAQAERDQLGREGRQRMHEHYSITAVAAQYDALCDALSSSRGNGNG